MESNTGLKDLLYISSSLAIIILVISVAKIIAYWDAFNIPITNYLAFSDLPLHAYAIVLNVKFGVFIIFIGYLFLPDSSKLLIAINKNFSLWFIFFVLIFLISLVTCYYGRESLVCKGKHWLYMAAFVGGLSLFLILCLVKLRFSPSLEYSSMVFFYSLFFCIYLYAASRITAKTEVALAKQGYYSKTLIRFKDGRPDLTSNDKSFYIGNTSNFVFFYNAVDRSTQVIPISDVLELTIYTQQALR